MNQELKPYSRTKSSGIDWLGDIPGHWKIVRGKHLFRCIDERSSTGSEELLTVSSDRGVVPRASTSVTMFKAASYVGHKLCWPGDLVINSLWAWAGGLGVSKHKGIISSAYGVYRLRRPSTHEAAYFHRLFRSNPFNFELQVRSKGIWTSRLQLTDEAFLGAPVPLPPYPEQNAIARFLDHMDRRIQKYIRAKEKLIVLLDEYKQVLIHQAVTGQIDIRTGEPYSEYKKSGVEWLGRVPSHWDVASLKWVSDRSLNGTTPPTSEAHYYEHGTVPWYGPSSCGESAEVGQPIRLLNKRAFVQGAARLIRGPALLVVVIGATAGRMTLMPKNGSTNQQITAFELSSDRLNPLFLLYQLQLSETWLRSSASTATIPILSSDLVNRLPCAMPPLSEQIAISHSLGQVLNRLDHVIASSHQQIGLVQTYRTRLIADAVTGKLDVRETASGLPNLDPIDDYDECNMLNQIGTLDLDEATAVA